ncbi:MAG: hypothetical protein QGH76_04480 [Phycisphaerales bacterium]|jgi:hypothetical protein|nr:hypothetical protein [Phycisphaerales bacterium]
MTIQTSVVLAAVLAMAGCNESQKISGEVQDSDGQSREIEVEVDENVIVLSIDGEMQTIDLGNVLGESLGDLGTLGDHGVMVVEVQADGQEPIVMQRSFGRDHPGRPMQGGHRGEGRGEYGPGNMGQMHERIMQEMHERRGERHEGHDDDNEAREFIGELHELGEVSQMLSRSSSVALLGIHMIRDNFDPEVVVGAMEDIIEETAAGSAANNAALIVMMEALGELDNEDGALDAAIDLVVGNSPRREHHDED